MAMTKADIEEMFHVFDVRGRGWITPAEANQLLESVFFADWAQPRDSAASTVRTLSSGALSVSPFARTREGSPTGAAASGGSPILSPTAAASTRIHLDEFVAVLMRKLVPASGPEEVSCAFRCFGNTAPVAESGSKQPTAPAAPQGGSSGGAGGHSARREVPDAPTLTGAAVLGGAEACDRSVPLHTVARAWTRCADDTALTFSQWRSLMGSVIHMSK